MNWGCICQMEHTTQVLRAISKGILFFGFAAVFTNCIGTVMDISFYPAVTIASLFAYMILDDFQYQTVDIRMLILLIASMWWASSEPTLSFISTLCLSFVFFRCLLLALTLAMNRKDSGAPPGTEEADPSIPTERMPIGYLPVLGASLLFYLIYCKLYSSFVPGFLLPTHDGILTIMMFLSESTEAAGTAIVVLLLIWAFLERWLWKEKVAGTDIAYAYGDGDVFVLGAFTAFFGTETLGLLFFISQILTTILYFIRAGGETIGTTNQSN